MQALCFQSDSRAPPEFYRPAQKPLIASDTAVDLACRPKPKYRETNENACFPIQSETMDKHRKTYFQKVVFPVADNLQVQSSSQKSGQ